MKRILFVADFNDTAHCIQEAMLSQYQVQLCSMKNAEDVSHMIRMFRPDMVFLSYEMPLCEGRIMLEMIRSDEKLRKLPVVFLTKIAEKKNIASIIRLKPAGCILKPLDKEMVTRIIEKCLG